MTVIEMTPSRPVLRYHGGKFKIAPWIIEHFPRHQVYVEPFAGGASVLMQKPRVAAEVYNDLNDDVVNLFRILRDPVQAAELARRVELTPFARAEFDAVYSPAVDAMDQAHKLIVRAYLGRGGDAATRQCRSGFTTLLSEGRALPAQAFAKWPDAVPAIVARLRGVLIECRPALEVIKAFDTPGTLTYCDPPYVHSARSALKGRGKKSHGYKHEMTDDDHRELANLLHGVKGMALVSGYPSDLYNELYGDWKRVTTKAVAEGGAARVEVLWMNPACAAALYGEQAQLGMDFA